MVEALFASVDEEVGKGGIGPGLGKPGGANAKGNAFLAAVSTPSAAKRWGAAGTRPRAEKLRKFAVICRGVDRSGLIGGAVATRLST